MASRFTYSRWDGTQVGFDLDADRILEEMTDDLLYHGDLNAALRRMMQSGFRDQNGERLAGLRELMEKLRRRRKESARSMTGPVPGEPGRSSTRYRSTGCRSRSRHSGHPAGRSAAH